MNIKSGDPIFTSRAHPVLVQSLDEEKHKLIVDQDPETVRTAFRHGYIKGLEHEEREVFNQCLDEIKEIQDSEERIEEFKTRVDELEKNIHTTSDLRVLRYLKSELSHMMHVERIQPRLFEVDEGRTRF